MEVSNKIEINEGFAQALDLMEKSGRHLFITGKAGTGKSTLLEYFRARTKKKIAVLAPTGVAALNVRGQTIHSFFRFHPNITAEQARRKRLRPDQQKLYKNLETVVIDEVSMTRADLMDCIDVALRHYRGRSREPFGGVQMIFIGDLYQLPPVVSGKEERELFRTEYASPYFFSAKIISAIEMEFVELEKVYRQKDEAFIALLNKIRNNSVEEEDMVLLNKRYSPKFRKNDASGYVTLTPTNAAADGVNYEKLAGLYGKPRSYYGEMLGDFEDKNLPTALRLEVKKGAQVMLLNNDAKGRWVNGSIGTISDIKKGKYDDPSDIISVKLAGGEKEVEVRPYTWEMHEYFFDKSRGLIDTKVVGSFTQYPLRLAWAITIHKSQGKTFDNVIIDIGRGAFAHGQVYVALSRCRSFNGLIFRKPILKGHIWMDRNIVRFLTRFQYDQSDAALPFEKKLAIIRAAISAKKPLAITYLKPNDEKSRRVVDPHDVGEMEYQGKTYIGLAAYCRMRRDERVFRVDRILELATE